MKTPPKKIICEDGFAFYLWENGGVGDHPTDPEKADMS